MNSCGQGLSDKSSITRRRNRKLLRLLAKAQQITQNVMRRPKFMKAHQPAPRQRLSQRSFSGVALLIVCVLLAHTFDNCAAHLDEFVRSASATQQFIVSCSNNAETCPVCAPAHQPAPDVCDLVSEDAVRNSSSQHQLEHSIVTLAATAVVLPPTPQLFALSGSLHGRAEPPPSPFLSTTLRLGLPNRAPPLSA